MMDIFTSIIQLISIAIATSGVYYAYKNAEYVRRQRLDQISPIVVIGRQPIFLHLDILSNPTYWFNIIQSSFAAGPAGGDKLNISEKNYYYGYPVAINNIGRGVAKNIRASFDFDASKIITEINNLNSEYEYGTHVSTEGEYLLIKHREGMIKEKIERNSNLDFIVPVQGAFGYNIVPLPAYIRILISIYLKFSLNKNFDISALNSGILNFLLEIRFEDIDKKEVSSKYNVSIIVREYRPYYGEPLSVHHNIYAEFIPEMLS